MNYLVEPPEAYRGLCQQYALDSGIPYVEKWSAAADFLQLITDHVTGVRPSRILECGTGLTTLMLAAACKQVGNGQIISLEHEEEYALRSQQVIAHYKLSHIVQVIHAPLVPYDINDREYLWYSLDALPEISVDMLVVDGPPGPIQEHSRFPAVPLLVERFANDCHIFLDDAARQEEQEVVDMWTREFDVSLRSYIELERGCARLVRSG